MLKTVNYNYVDSGGVLRESTILLEFHDSFEYNPNCDVCKQHRNYINMIVTQLQKICVFVPAIGDTYVVPAGLDPDVKLVKLKEVTDWEVANWIINTWQTSFGMASIASVEVLDTTGELVDEWFVAHLND